MRFHFIFFCCYILSTALTHAQNLVPNPSFENEVGCPNNFDQVYLTQNWHSYGQSPDYYNSCDYSGGFGVPSNIVGYQNAAIGNAYCGLYTSYAFSPNYREYIGSRLLSNLVPGIKYYVSMDVSLANQSNCATNNLGIIFLNRPYTDSLFTPIFNHAMIFSPDIIADTTNWTSVSGSFISDSAYQYIMIGNMFQQSKTDTLQLTGYPCNAYYYIDNVCVSTDSLGCYMTNAVRNYSNSENIISYPNPANEEVFIGIKNSLTVNYTIINSLGENVKTIKANGVISIDVSDLPDGIYFLEINYNDNFFFKKQIIIH